MRIAWLTPYLPAPENSGGRIRIANLARAFDAKELHLYARHAGDDPALESLDLSQWQAVHARRDVWPRSPEFVTPHLPLSFPRAIKHLLARHDQEHSFDAVIVEHCYSAHALPAFQRAAVIVNEQNVESEYWLRAVRSRPQAAVKNMLAYLRWRRFETNVWRSADAVAVVSDKDRARVQQIRPDTGVVIPNGIALERYTFIPPSRRTGRALLFVGLLSYAPNIQAAQLLATRVLPLVQRRFPDATLTLAGRDPHRSVRALASASVRVTGTLPDIARVFDDHAVFAMPIAFGAGSSLKVLEPLAAGVPLVASPFAVRGFKLQPGVHYTEADTPARIADAVCAILSRSRSLDAMAERGRAIAEQHAWRSIRERFGALVRETARSKQRRAA